MKAIEVVIEKISVDRGLSVLNFEKTSDMPERLFTMYSAIHRMENYIMTNESAGEISVLMETVCKPIVQNLATVEPNFQRDGIAAISIRYNASLADKPILFTLLKSIVPTGINIIEYATTRNEITFFVEEKDEKALVKVLKSFQSC